MKKIIIVLTICFILTGCSLFDKKPTNETIPSNNSTTPKEELTGDKVSKIYNTLNDIAYSNYEKEEFKEIISKDKKVSVATLKEKEIDVSSIEKECGNLCDLDNTYITVDYSNTENPITIDIAYSESKKVEESKDVYQTIYNYAKIAYDSGEYKSFETEASENGDIYVISLGDLAKKYNFDLSSQKCDYNKTKVKYFPIAPSVKDVVPISIIGCD